MAYAEKVHKVRNGKQTKQFTWRACYKNSDGGKGTEPGFCWKANRRKPPKNKFSAREIDVPEFLVSRLSAHLETRPHAYPFSTPKGPLWLRGNFTSRHLRPAADGRKAIPRKRGYIGRDEWLPDRALRFLTMGWVPTDIEGTYAHVTPEMRRHRLVCPEARWERGQRVALQAAS